MIRAVIFDFDDTLITTIDTKIHAIQFAGKHFYGIDIPEERIRTHWGKPYQKFISDVFGDVEDFESISAKYVSIRDKFPASTHKDALETVNTLLEKNFVIGVVTSGTRHNIESDMKLLNFPLEKIILQTADDTDVHKPDPKVFEPILKKLQQKNITKEEVIYVGDNLVDFFAARDAGIVFYGIPDRTVKKSEFIKYNATVIEEVSDILKLVTEQAH